MNFELYPRLRALKEIFPEHGDCVGKLENLQLIHVTRRNAAWVTLQSKLSELSDELTRFGEDVPPSQRAKRLRGLPAATSDIRELANMTAELLDCSKCEGRNVSEVRLRLETFRSKSPSEEANSLCLLVADSPSRNSWHEFSIHGRRQWQK